ncbi:SDR family NAD(P)-dependent oxidoreductase [Actinacidiphila glaucinigra]|uniref:3-oxoacyl-[acyl-carrier protein] reductase n=1 Tax=Actinacidiphila glaucinigra TaxID=235986 RepID=A0A239JMB3_9ACTN|nr:SDR family oxidoreductase [Actinacidiphila glaucinigra]SNT06558.1 3-oxoacyl-[acyl-carrier protein] reductase [Actinacidiphila glaucinigra]
MAQEQAEVLQGRRALVTGGSRGIGAGIVRRLVREGASVAFTYVHGRQPADALVEELSAAGGRVLALQADSADAAAVKAALERAVAELGGLDILVNNAGVGVAGLVDDFSFEDFDRMVAVNVRGVFAAIKAALPHLGDGGRIISTGSINADRVPIGGIAVYAMTKAAVAGLTRGLARELAPRGITINNVQVGATETDMLPDDPAFIEALTRVTAVDRFAQPRDIAGVVAFLARPEAWFVTGANWNVDGGYTV